LLQGCGLFSIPAQLAAASRLQRLRIGDNGDCLNISREDLEVLSAMQALSFVSIAKVSRNDVLTHCSRGE